MNRVTFTGPHWDKIPEDSEIVFPYGGEPFWRKAGTNDQGEQLYEITMRLPMLMRLGPEPTPIDDNLPPGECECDFTPDPEDPNDLSASHYYRRCLFCGCKWWGLHCPHDGYQNPCPKCGKRPVPVSEG